MSTEAGELQITADEVAPLIQKPVGDARAALEYLVEIGLVEARGTYAIRFGLVPGIPGGKRRSRVYYPSSWMYQRLADLAAYVRQRGFDAIQHEQMVLQFVQRTGRTTRKEGGNLCRITSDQAQRLVQRLVDKGKLQAYGAGKSRWYGPAPRHTGASKS